MNPKPLWISIAAAAALSAVLVWAFAPRPLAVEVARATMGPYEQSVVEDARTRLRDRYALSAPLAGRLARIALREGDAVQAGAVVTTITPALSPMLDERTRREQSARVEAAEAAVRRADAGIQRARVAVEQARIELRRNEQLAQQDFVSAAKVDTDRLALQAAQTDLDVALQSRQVSGYERDTARAALVAIRATGSSEGIFAVRAPVSGSVLRVAQTSETTVTLGAPLIEIGDTTRLEIVAELLTTDALQALPGVPVRVERWGGGGMLEGRVRRVEPAAFTKVSALGIEEQRVNVLIDLVGSPDQWRALGDGYRVGVRIVTLFRSSVLRVPVSAVFPQPGGAMAVFVVDGGRARLRPIELGGRNGSEAWVRGGLAEGAEVIVYPPTALRDGMRVKVRAVR
ncbi:efflux RND transporter periplasmic adaptor subunit [Variovorax paradoxus]|uniref:efflux RND transporter periplasmic adaptor subunit n=1 Tax=Variovorax paradoxus TaxID=34073 RepID=UPI00277EA179|nr:HlyD family efflux transporter periplasmic adaptor subunit [Variovorax paradoxus]MDP9927965.1 HlyD family secretion protein [Variovorax paradoxus]